MNFFIALFLAILGPQPSDAAVNWKQELPPALAAAKKNNSWVLVDFTAPWCYSCYYMESHVLNQPELEKLQNQLELVRMDVDSDQGAKLEKDWQVHFLPSYVIVDAQGQEVGRIIGEQVPADFYSQLRTMLSRHSTLNELKNKLSEDSAREILISHAQKREGKEGLAFLVSLAEDIRSSLGKDAQARLAILRLRLFAALDKKDALSCVEIGRTLLPLVSNCDLPYDSMFINRCLETASKEDRQSMFTLEKGQLEPLLKRKIFVSPEKRCADFRSPIELAVDIADFEGNKEDASKVLNKAIDLLHSEIGNDYKKDRNRDDNLRVFLEMAKRDDELDALYPKLIEAFPDDYVYHHRYGKFLMAHKRVHEAIAHFDAALLKAYGANKLSVIEQRNQALALEKTTP